MSSHLDSQVPEGAHGAGVPAGALAATPPPRWREVLAPPLVALVTLVVALWATDAAGIRFRDPDNVAAGYFALVGFAVALLVGLDVWIRAARATGARRPPREAMRAVRRARWTRGRMVAAGGALLSFYVSYLAYRNLKAVLPFLRPGELFDRELADIDRALFAGQDPAALLHQLLGIGLPTHVLSTFYAAFIVFLPLSLAIALVFSPDLPTSLFFATALSLNWLLGAGSYFLLPALGPVYADPAAFAALHVAMSFTSLVAAHMLGLGRRLKGALWAWLVITCVATIYLGWHYVLDDVAGLAIGAASLALARVLMQYDLRAARRERRTRRPLASATA